MNRAEQDLLAAESTASVRELQGAVTFAMDLLVKLPKLKPPEADDEGVDALRDALTDPTKVVDRLQVNPKFVAALRAKGWLPPPEKVAHRPTKEQQAHRQEYAEREKEMGLGGDPGADDSELQRMLRQQPREGDQ